MIDFEQSIGRMVAGGLVALMLMGLGLTLSSLSGPSAEDVKRAREMRDYAQFRLDVETKRRAFERRLTADRIGAVLTDVDRYHDQGR